LSTGEPLAEEAVAIFGGSFNPPHVAHVLAAVWALSVAAVERVVVVPTFLHPFAKTLAPYDDRLRMCELAFGWLPRVHVSRVEEELGGESRTVRTLEHLAALHPGWRMRLLMGADLVAEADKWFRFDRVRELAPPLVLGRAGFDIDGVTGAVLPAISSTHVRGCIAGGRWEELAPLVPEAVRDYVRQHRLYER
jgi:nicotinate-nucleotide adenylyltransferase